MNARGGSKTQGLHHAISGRQLENTMVCTTQSSSFISCCRVCIPIRSFGHVEGSVLAPRCFWPTSILSMIQDMNGGQGIPSVREFRLFRTLLLPLSPRGAD